MRPSAPHRIAAPFLILAIGALAGTACSDAPRSPTAVGGRPFPAFSMQAPSARGGVIRQRVADKRAAHLTPDEVARVKSLRGTWQWAADMHHVVMQEAIHDPSLGGLRQPRTAAERCAIALRYLKKHYPKVEEHSGRHISAAARVVVINTLASEIGGCKGSASQASIFAVSPSRAPSARVSHAGIRTPTGVIDIEQVATAWHDYIVPMSADIHAAKDLSDATEIMDTYLAAASADPEVPVASLGLIAGSIDLATSSANEWDAFARPREASMFLWGWLTDLGTWVADVVVSDLSGCAIAMGGDLAGMTADGWSGTSSDLSIIMEGSCFLGAVFGSVGAAI